MDEKDRIITEIYNESKERARWLQPFSSSYLHSVERKFSFILWCLILKLNLFFCSASQGQWLQEADRNPAAET